MNILEYYSQDWVQEEIAKLAKDREVAVAYGKDKFGKRPDIIQFKSDVLEFAKKGATSFHFSEEHWKDALLLKPGMTKKELDGLRKGFDLILDIDTKNFDYAKKTAFLLIEAIRFYGVKSIFCKFSGGSGFHIGIPMKAMPNKVKGTDIRLLFPDCLKIVAEFLKDIIKEKLIEITEDEDVFSTVDIDSGLISSRHMFRGVYSINEKSGLISIPVVPDDVMRFNREDASMDKVERGIVFLDDSEVEAEEARYLVNSAFDWHEKKEKRKEVKEEFVKSEKKDYEPLKEEIKEELFPPCVKKMLEGVESDGRKRTLFILINFLANSGYTFERIKEKIKEWNEKNYEPLKEGYVNSQLIWFKKQGKTPMPPNCANKDYYLSLGVCVPDNWCKFIKNPVNYGVRKKRVLESNKKPKRKRS